MVKLKRYGCPYKGSKSMIVDKFVDAIPYVGVDNFYDLFAGGCAVTHKMLLEHRYKTVYANDKNGLGVRLFVDAINGKFRDERRWISREDFFANKGIDPYITLCWSFGNNMREYLYSRIIEPYKKACHYAVVFGDYSLLRELCPEVVDVCEGVLNGIEDIKERRLKFGRTVVSWLKKYGTIELVKSNPLYSSCHVKKDTESRPKGSIRDLQSLESLERLQSLERLESLERLQSLQSLETSIKDYKDVEISPNSVIYCDIPYKGKDGYVKRSGFGFEFKEFYDWCCYQKELVLISELWMPEDRFICVWCKDTIHKICNVAPNPAKERLFVPKSQLQKYKEMMLRSYPATLVELIS